jgi:hypothetical protein
MVGGILYFNPNRILRHQSLLAVGYIGSIPSTRVNDGMVLGTDAVLEHALKAIG